MFERGLGLSEKDSERIIELLCRYFRDETLAQSYHGKDKDILDDHLCLFEQLVKKDVNEFPDKLRLYEESKSKSVYQIMNYRKDFSPQIKNWLQKNPYSAFAIYKVLDVQDTVQEAVNDFKITDFYRVNFDSIVKTSKVEPKYFGILKEHLIIANLIFDKSIGNFNISGNKQYRAHMAKIEMLNTCKEGLMEQKDAQWSRIDCQSYLKKLGWNDRDINDFFRNYIYKSTVYLPMVNFMLKEIDEKINFLKQ